MISRNTIDINKINEIIKKIINEIDNSRTLIFDIVENTREEYELLKARLDDIKKVIDKVIGEVDTLEIQDKVMRKKLATVSKEFTKYTEVDIKNAYDKASEIKVAYKIKQNEEKILREKRTQLELSLKRAINNIKHAEEVVNQVSIALNYLTGDILSVFEGMDKNSEMFLGIKILEAQENERKRISRDIHDGPAQHIANIVMKADICEKIVQDDLNEGLNELAELKEAVQRALKEVRSIIFDLRPMTLDDLGLNQTVRELVKSYNDGSKIHLKLKSMKTEVESIIQVAVYRIIQEVLNNIRKHAKASNVYLILEYGTKYLRLIISDDGIGFNVDDTLKKVKTKGEHYGLIGIFDRVHQLQGDIHIESKDGAGTIYNIKLPVNREVIKDEETGN